MSTQYARNIKDATLQVTRALPTSDGTVTSSDIDLGPGEIPEIIEFAVDIPALNATQLPDADTITITHQSGASATPTTARDIEVLTGSTGVPAQQLRFRASSNGGRYHNFKFVAAGGTGDISGSTATISVVV